VQDVTGSGNAHAGRRYFAQSPQFESTFEV